MSVKLLKVFVILVRLKCCSDGNQTAKTFADLSKLLFCISHFTELKDTIEQRRLTELCDEAKALVSQP